MKHRSWSWMVVALAVLTVAGCAQKAEEKLIEAERDLAAAWAAERDAAADAMRSSIASVDRRVDTIRARAAELEAEAEGEAAELWRRAADELEEARAAASRDLEMLEDAGADAWASAKDATANTIEKLERAEARVAAFAAEEKDTFVAEAKRAVEEGERELAWARERVAEAGDAAKQEWREAVADLEKTHRAAVAELEKIERADSEAWGDLRHGFVAAYHDLRDASERAAGHFREV